MALIFLDSNVVIYLIEQPAGWGPRAAARIASAQGAGDAFAISDLVRMECRVHPLSIGDAATLGQFEAFFTSSHVQVMAINRAVCDRAASIRALYRFRPLDALHLAAAVEAGCDTFLTNDNRLNAFSDITIEPLP